MTVRSPIVVVLGHVDHGKTLLLDKVRGTAIAAKEPGAITQHVGASFIPTDVVKERCKDLLKKYGFKLNIPGLLFIDTPGHEAFTNLRKRGGSIADLAILVIDVTQGIQPQTIESIKILKIYKTPFIIVANKIDLINGWIKNKNQCYTDTFEKQRDFVQQELEKKLYGLIGELTKYGFDSDIFTNVEDPTKQILIIPTSAKTGEGIPELLIFLAGLSQKFMEKKLHIDMEKSAKGSVLEVKEVTGLGMTIDVIIYEGCVKVGDEIAVAGFDGVFVTKIRALLQPAPLEEIRDPRKKFKNVKKIYAAAGLKIAAPELEKTIPGSPFLVVKDKKKAVKIIEEELESIKIKKESLGVIVKTDALGSLEALVDFLSKSGIPVRSADVGMVTKKDLLEAETVKNSNRYLGVLFAFNTKIPQDVLNEAKKNMIKVFQSDIIYKLEEDYVDWKKDEEKLEKEEKLTKYIYPAKVIILPGYVFRQSKPAIVGVEVLGGILKSRTPLMNSDGEIVGRVQSIQEQNQSIKKAEVGMQVAVSIEDATVGRQIDEKEILYTAVPIKQIYELLDTFEDKELIQEIKKIREGG